MKAYIAICIGAGVKTFPRDEDVPFADFPMNFKNALYFGTMAKQSR